MKYTIKIGKIKEGEKEHFEHMNPGYKCTGETLAERFVDDDVTQVYIVMRGKFTRYGMCRDCGDHYILARWDRYDRIDKNTLKFTRGVEDR